MSTCHKTPRKSALNIPQKKPIAKKTPHLINKRFHKPVRMLAHLQPPDITKGERGMMIVFEGLDRSGKSSQAKLTAEKLTNHGIPAQYIVFPDRSTSTGQKINAFLTKEIELTDQEIHLLFSENRKEAQESMEKALKSGVSLIVDRYSYSGAVFTAAKNARGLDLQWAFSQEIGFLAPDAVFYMNISPEVQLKRGGFGQERYESTQMQEKARAKFDRLIDLSPTWGTYKDSLKRQEYDNNAFISPWYKINADLEYNDVTLCITSAIADVYQTVKSHPLKKLTMFSDI